MRKLYSKATLLAAGLFALAVRYGYPVRFSGIVPRIILVLLAIYVAFAIINEWRFGHEEGFWGYLIFASTCIAVAIVRVIMPMLSSVFVVLAIACLIKHFYIPPDQRF